MYNNDLLRVMALDIANRNDDMYSKNNNKGCLSEVPFNYYLRDTSKFEQYCKRVLRSHNPQARIHIIEDHYTEVSVVGGYYELGNDYHIVINPNANTCWKRFALIKELCSLYTNHYGRTKGKWVLHTSEDYEQSLEISYHQKAQITKAELDEGDLDSDTFAILLATELMIPPKYRRYTDILLDRVRDGEMTMNDIAQSLSIPEYMLHKLIELDFYSGSCNFYTEQLYRNDKSEIDLL